MTKRATIPEFLREHPFTYGEANAAGVSAGRLRAADITRPFHGVLSTMTELSHDGLCAAYSLRMPEDTVFSHDTAARLMNLPLPLYLSHNAVHVTRRAGSARPVGRGVAGHELEARLWSSRSLVRTDPKSGRLFELRTIEPAIVWAQLATALDLADLVALGDAMVWGATRCTSRARLSWAAEAWAGRRGARQLRAAIGCVREGSLSRAESLHRQLIVAAGIPEPELNVIVLDRQGNEIAMADEVWSRYRVLAEYEGDGHRTSRGKFRSDIVRFERYADGEWAALRAQADDLFVDPNPFIARLWRRLVKGGWRPSLREPRHIASARR